MKLAIAVTTLTAACASDPNWYRFDWGFSCPDGTWFICRDEGYFHCDSGPPTYNPGPRCTFVSAVCTSNPRPGESEQQIACNGRPPSCAGTIACTTAPPACPSGQVPGIAASCYTGTCVAVAACDTPPPCTAINDEADCAARADCTSIYDGIDCMNPMGTACHAGDTDCTCADFVFASCGP
jgi:hypothetical protein